MSARLQRSRLIGVQSGEYRRTVLAVGALLAAVIPRKERHLVQRFGTAYEEYRKRTDGLLPLKKGVKGSY